MSRRPDPRRWVAPLSEDGDGWWGPLRKTDEASVGRQPEALSPLAAIAIAGPDPSLVDRIYKMIDDPASDASVFWAPDGSSFFVRSGTHFTALLLPKHFNHRSYSRFLLDLSTFGFRFRFTDGNLTEFAKDGFVRGPRHPVQKGFGFSLKDSGYAKERIVSGQAHPLQKVHAPILVERPLSGSSSREFEVKEETDGSGLTSSLFLTKVYCMVSDTATDHVISWLPSGCSFVVRNLADFSRDRLPKYSELGDFYNFALMVCLNGFKFRSTADNLQLEFAKEGFIRGQRPSLQKISGQKTIQSSLQGFFSMEPKMKQEIIEDTVEIKQELAGLKGRIKELSLQSATQGPPGELERGRAIMEIAQMPLQGLSSEDSEIEEYDMDDIMEDIMDVKEDIAEIKDEMMKLKEDNMEIIAMLKEGIKKITQEREINVGIK